MKNGFLSPLNLVLLQFVAYTFAMPEWQFVIAWYYSPDEI